MAQRKPTPAQLANLNPFNRKGSRNTITKEFVTDLTQYLSNNKERFVERMESLSDRDYVAAYLKLTDMIVPKKIEATVEETEKPNWTIQLASQVATPTPAQLAEYTEDVEDDEDTDKNDADEE